MCNKSQALLILDEVVKRACGVFEKGIVNAYLYGSYARGDYDSESDVDILVTVDEPLVELSKYRNAMARITSDLSLEFDVTVSVSVKSLEHFNRYNKVLPYYQNVLREGIAYAI